MLTEKSIRATLRQLCERKSTKLLYGPPYSKRTRLVQT